MAKATVGINFVITQGANGMQQLTVQAKDLRDVMQETMRITRKLSHETVGFTVLSTGLRNAAEAKPRPNYKALSTPWPKRGPDLIQP